MKNTVLTLQKQKEDGEKIIMVTAYDYTTTKIMDEAGVNTILVGDSLGMTMLGYEDTLSVTMVKDLNMPLEIVGCPIVREADGLAKSSRNTYLSEEERKAALVLSRAVFMAKEMTEQGERDAKKIVSAMKAEIEKEPLAKIDYVKAVATCDMQQVEKIEGEVLIAIAVYIGKTRLIDNVIVNA